MKPQKDKFARVERGLFLDPKFRPLTAEAQITYIWLRAVHATSSGLAFMSAELAATERKATACRMREIFAELERAGFLEIDEEENLVRTAEEARVYPMDSPFQVKGTLNTIRRFPASPLRDRAVAQVVPMAIAARRKFRTSERRHVAAGKADDANTSRKSMTTVDCALRDLIDDLGLASFLRNGAGLPEEDLVYLAEITGLRELAPIMERVLESPLYNPSERQKTETETETKTETATASADSLLQRWRTDPDFAPPVPGRMAQ